MDMTTTASAGPAVEISAGRRRWLLVLLALIYASNFVDRSILATLAPSIKKELHLSDSQIGILGGFAFAFLYTLLSIPLARVAERKSRVILIGVCTAIWSAMTMACGAAQTFAQLAAARVGVGIGEAGCLPASNSLISDHYPQSKRATAIAVLQMGIPLGTLIGAVAGGWIALHFGWRAAFAVVGAPGLLLALLAFLTLKDPPRGYADGAVVTTDRPPSMPAVLRRLWERRAAIYVCVAAVAATTTVYGVLTFTASYYARRFGMDVRQAGLAAGMVTGVGAGISMLTGGTLTDLLAKFDKRAYAWVSIFGLVLALPLYVIGFTRPDWQSAVLFMTAGAAAQQLYVAPTFAVANNVVEPRMRATAVAMMTFCWTLVGLGIGPVVVGVASDHIRAFLAAGGSDVLGLCHQAGCTDASATGLQYALIGVIFLDLIGIVMFVVASGRMKRDFV